MHPATMVAAFLDRQLDVVAISDHNASDNVASVVRAAAATRLTIIPGMEVTTREEVHVLALFERLETLRDFEQYVFSAVPADRDHELRTAQMIVNEHGTVLGHKQRSLMQPAPFSISELTGHIHARGGLAIASHVDRACFGVLGQLGAIPEDAGFDALELSAACGIARGRDCYPELERYAFITSSDAHFPGDIGRAYTRIRMARPSLDELRLAFARSSGRAVLE